MARPVPLSRLALELGINPRKWLGLPQVPKASGVSQRRVNDYRDNLAQVRGPAGYARETSHDRRTIRSVQRLTQELTENARPSEIARGVGISTQRWVAIRKGIEQGEIYSPELRENLKQAIPEVVPEHEIKYSPDGSAYDYFPNDKKLEHLVPWARDITPKGKSSLDQAAEWWEKIGGGAAYFVIAAGRSEITGRKVYKVFDIRTAGELKNKGHLKNEIRARKIIQEEYGK